MVAPLGLAAKGWTEKMETLTSKMYSVERESRSATPATRA